jgi:diacylglycerol kinase family enzyme
LSGFLLVNPNAGSSRPTAAELAVAAAEHDVHVHVLAPDDDPAELARAADADALGAAGGDGTLGCVADVAIERDLPFVCVPFGTRNHFARDAGLDRSDPIAALAAFGGEERRVDVGRVNGRLFLNNVSLGVYARLVNRRERHRRRRKALARVRALVLTARARHPARVLLDGVPIEAPIVLVANNEYKVELFELGERERLDEGLLHLYVARGLYPNDWQGRAAPAFTLDSDQRVVVAAIDGEPHRIETPLRFESQAGALRLLLPPGI